MKNSNLRSKRKQAAEWKVESEIEMILLNSVYIKYTLENLGSNKRRSDIA